MIFGNWLWPVETAPASLGSLRELEDHRQRGLVGEASLRAHGGPIQPHSANSCGPFENLVLKCRFEILEAGDADHAVWHDLDSGAVDRYAEILGDSLGEIDRYVELARRGIISVSEQGDDRLL
jgi:hypothetical protein